MPRFPSHRSMAVGPIALGVAALAAFATSSFTPPDVPQGPGVPQKTWAEADLYTTVGSMTPASGARSGHTIAMPHRGYVVILESADGGKGNGSIAVWDVSDLASPQLVVRKHDDDTRNIREAHAIGRMTWQGRDIAHVLARDGIQFWDWTDITKPVRLSELKLPPMRGGDYGSTPWWLASQGGWVYVGGTESGLHIIDGSNPRAPRRVALIPSGQTGGFRMGPIYACGNFLAISAMDGSGISTFDISTPDKPRLLATSKERIGYSTLFNGGKLYNIHTRPQVWDVSEPGKINLLTQTTQTVGGKGGYGYFQDGFLHMGASSHYAKVDVRDPVNVKLVNNHSSGVKGSDQDGGNVIGNLAFSCSDHGDGTYIVPHQTAPDTEPPVVNFISPAADTVDQAVTSRIGVTFTDLIDLNSVNASTFIVRPVGGVPISGQYSHVAGIVNFWPDQPLIKGMTYEVELPAGGIRDWAGNAMTAAFTSRFSTGSVVSDFVMTVAPAVPVTVGEIATLRVEKTDLPADTKIEYSFDFGDGSPATPFASAATATHRYDQPGHYTVIIMARADRQVGGAAVPLLVHHPVTATRPTHSTPIVFDARTRTSWNVNPDTDTVTAIAVPAGERQPQKLAEVAVGLRPQTLAFAPDGTLWVANQDDATISIIDPAQRKAIGKIDLPFASRPFGLAFSPDAKAGYVALEATGQLAKLDPVGRKVSATIDLGPFPRGLAVSADGKRIFITRFKSPADRGQVYEVDAATFALRGTIDLAYDLTPDTEDNGRGVPNYLTAIAISPDGSRAWIPSKKDNTARGLFRDDQPLTFESTVRTIISAIELGDGQNNPAKENLNARRDFNDRDMANAVAFSPLGNLIFVATQGTNTVEIMDAYTGNILGVILETGLAPQGLAISDDGSTLLVHNFTSRTVAIYSVAALLRGDSNAAEYIASVPTVAQEKLSQEVLRGKQVFYNASDSRMGKDMYISCASCHQDGDDDGQVWDFTQRGEGLRNTIALRGKAGMAHGHVHWSANFDEIQDFEHDIREEFGGTGFLDDNDLNTETRNTPLGTPKAGMNEDLDALAAFVASLDNFHASPHRQADGSLTVDARAGKAIFKRLDCASCHSGTHYTDSPVGLLHDVGTLKATSGTRMNGRLWGIDTPTLRDLWQTAPYLHDGSAATLEQVLTTANASGAHGNTATLSSAERKQLVAYLLSIDGIEAGAADAPPLIALAPLPRTLEPGSTLSMQATLASNASGAQISKVEYFNGERKIGESTAVPYRMEWESLPPGRLELIAVAVHTSSARSATRPTMLDVTPKIGSGTGLRAEIFEDDKLRQRISIRLEPGLDFDFGKPDLLAGDTQGKSVRLTGHIQASSTEEFTLQIDSNQDVRLWIDGKQVIESKGPMRQKKDNPVFVGTKVKLEKGRLYELRVEAVRKNDDAVTILWTSESTKQAPIPASALFPSEISAEQTAPP